MKSLRLPPIAIAGIGFVLCLILVLVMLFVLIKPKQDALDAQTARYNAAYPDSTPQAAAQAQKKLAAARVQVAAVKSQWNSDDLALMPRYNVHGSLLTAWQQQVHELAYYLGPHIERWIPTTGVVPLFGTVGLPSPVTDPNLVTSSPLSLPISGSGSSAGGGGQGGSPGGSLSSYSPRGGGGGGGGGGGTAGALSVGGDFRQILYHVQRWNTFDRLVLIDGLALHGNSPFMTASYNATVYIFPQGDDAPAAPLPKGPASGGAPAGGPGGFPGAPPGGFPGGRGGPGGRAGGAG